MLILVLLTKVTRQLCHRHFNDKFYLPLKGVVWLKYFIQSKNDSIKLESLIQ